MIGQTLAHYRVLEKLGQGGMGVVYKAEDTRLSRQVALKLLPAGFAGDPDRVTRLQREAQILASLNHPHIASIYGLEESEGVWFLILELVPGPTLADRLVFGPLPTQECLSIARQIAEALDAAHEKGIVHRDLKPANIKITPDGQVKVLDFGLAKAAISESFPADLSQSPTAAFGHTREGVVLGTAEYMSPEQARGKAVDKRTDLWSFGCVLYEALSDRRPFAKETASDIIAAILGTDPDWTVLPAGAPPSLQRLIKRCLEKDLKRRLRDMGDARLEIDEALAELSRPAPVLPSADPPGWPRQIARWILLGVLVILSAAAGWWIAFRRQPAATVVQVRRLTDFAGLEEFPALSPDGKSVAFSADTSGRRQIWVRLLAGGAPLPITRDPADHQYPRWSPDSASLIYYSPAAESGSEGTLWEISALGGIPRRLVSSVSGGDVSHDGKRIAYFRFSAGHVQLHVSSRESSGDQVIAQLPPDYKYLSPRWSPDDQQIGFQRGKIFEDEIFTVPSAGGEPRQMTQDGNQLSGFSWLPDGSGIVYASARGSTVLYHPTFNIWVSRHNRASRQLTFGEVSYIGPDLHPTGKLVVGRMRMGFDLWKYPIDGTAAENVRHGVRLTRQTGQVETPSASPGDQELVYLSDSGGHGNLWVMKLDASEARQITYERDASVALGVPEWSPDGKQIAFVSTHNFRGWDFGLWVVNPDGSNLRNLVERGGWSCWSRDSRWIYYAVSKQGVYHIEKVPAEGGSPASIRTDNALGPAISADGTMLYYATPQANANQPDFEIRVAQPENGPSRVLARIPGERIPSAAWTIHPLLSPDGKWVALLLAEGAGTNIWAIPTAGGQLRKLTEFEGRRALIARRVSWSSNSRFIYAAVGDGDADVVLMDGLTP